MTAVYRFGRFEVNTAARQLTIDERSEYLGARAFDVLLALIENRDRVVTKNELLELVWPGLVVEENNLSVQISALRKLLGRNAIATVTSRGYQFSADLVCLASGLQKSLNRPTNNLPQQISTFIGRERESAEIATLLRRSRLLTIVGTGGVGKTRQALQLATDVASEFADGAWFVDLAPLVDPSLVLPTVASVLCADLGTTQSQTQALVRRLTNQKLLLLLDNCEHVIAAASALVESVLAGARDVRVLATSREPLAIAGEQVFRLPSLALPEDKPISVEEALTTAAVQLFVERAKATDAHFAIDGHNANSIAGICRRWMASHWPLKWR